VTKRFTRRDFRHREIDIAIDDPKADVKPWCAKASLRNRENRLALKWRNHG